MQRHGPICPAFLSYNGAVKPKHSTKTPLSRKVAVVTGAGKGIGRAVAKAFVAAGAKVALISRSWDDLKSLKNEIDRDQNVFIMAGDAADEKKVQRFVASTLKKFGRIDCLVNNAGILTPRAEMHEVKTSDWDESIRVNLKAGFLFYKNVMPAMIRQKSGCVINVSSGAGKRAAPEWGPYAVSKFGVEGFTLAAAAEAAEYGIRVNAVNPGGTRTRMRAAAYPEEDPKTLPAPEDVAKLFVWLASANASNVSGKSIDFRNWKK